MLSTDQIKKINKQLWLKSLKGSEEKQFRGCTISEDSYIASGGQFNVYRLMRKKEKTPYVLKVLINSEINIVFYKKLRDKTKDLEKLKNANMMLPKFFWDFEGTLVCIEEFHQPLQDYVPSSINPEQASLAKAVMVADCVLQCLIDMSGESGKLSNPIYHLDIKPDNILMCGENIDEGVMLADFGVAAYKDHPNEKIYDEESEATRFKYRTGTLLTMAPERGEQDSDLYKADMYSLGCTLYYYLSGNYPAGTTEEINMLRLLSEKFVIEDLPAGRGSERLRKLVMKALEFRPENRFASYREMYKELQQCIEYKHFKIEKRMNGDGTYLTGMADFVKMLAADLGIEIELGEKVEKKVIPEKPSKTKQRKNAVTVENLDLIKRFCIGDETPKDLLRTIKKTIQCNYKCKIKLDSVGFVATYTDDIFEEKIDVPFYTQSRCDEIFQALLYRVDIRCKNFDPVLPIDINEFFKQTRNLKYVFVDENVEKINVLWCLLCADKVEFEVSENNRFFSSADGHLCTKQ